MSDVFEKAQLVLQVEDLKTDLHKANKRIAEYKKLVADYAYHDDSCPIFKYPFVTENCTCVFTKALRALEHDPMTCTCCPEGGGE